MYTGTSLKKVGLYFSVLQLENETSSPTQSHPTTAGRIRVFPVLSFPFLSVPVLTVPILTVPVLLVPVLTGNPQNNMLLTAKFVVFLCSVILQGKVVALDRWGGKWNQLSMTPRLTILSTDYAKNYCNRTLIVKVIVENVVTCFFMGHSK